MRLADLTSDPRLINDIKDTKWHSYTLHTSQVISIPLVPEYMLTNRMSHLHSPVWSYIRHVMRSYLTPFVDSQYGKFADITEPKVLPNEKKNQ